jgi:hypothetical protein
MDKNSRIIDFSGINLKPYKRAISHIWYEIKDKKTRVFLEGDEARKLRMVLGDVDKRIQQLQHIKSIVEVLLLHSGNKSET